MAHKIGQLTSQEASARGSEILAKQQEHLQMLIMSATVFWWQN